MLKNRLANKNRIISKAVSHRKEKKTNQAFAQNENPHLPVCTLIICCIWFKNIHPKRREQKKNEPED